MQRKTEPRYSGVNGKDVQGRISDIDDPYAREEMSCLVRVIANLETLFLERLVEFEATTERKSLGL